MTEHALPQTFEPSDTASAVEALKARFGEAASTGSSVLGLHRRDESHHAPFDPDIVVFPSSTEEVAEVLRIASRFRVPVTPWGTGSGLEGGAIPTRGGITLSMARLDRILEIRPDDMIARVEAGVRRKTLNRELRDTGLFFPVDPGADASLGGMASTGASGTNAVRYGVMRENVLGLTVVTAAGEIVKTGSLARKSSSGYDLTRLFVGSEGTLGVVTEVSLRLHPIADSVSALAGFETLEGAIATVIDIKRMGLSIGRVELLDLQTVHAINREHARGGPLALEPLPTLFFEFQHALGESDPSTEAIAEIVASHGGTPLRWMRGADAAQVIWDVRRDAMGWAERERPGSRSWSTDTCVPISALAESILGASADIAASSVPGYIIGHVGDGNFHCIFMMLPDEEDEVHAIAERIARRALQASGTATGEHGVGIGKREFLIEEHGLPAVTLMRTLKAALDPLDILNPGKVLPDLV
ncbi:FAD-binding protein [Mesorhizobium sp. RP14(2022)]|uniref:D-lactate dehydrogenase (cytochrome) n=1 Tax=Mesorhizobium liriopis TaxID=2953882 RepID=A0ABT1CB72_9HYPH|nr:FAD-linked oxidase C-terminal domain-containing protein [Mesorhizobium liriopis]MCO6051943.1 FAD-binding protein [Mesorhizobium liriopis]